ncbi:MAG: FAD-dependent oxidoreductase, partial [Hyphomicrobiales bacterium]|nr:FAD-dependent oxidoreductase [Hyphomicrobiales bacterium]
MPNGKLTSLDGQRFDVVIIGAGINGASSAQHLAAAGYSVLLVDKGDFGSGSTSRSSRLLHCGLRFFETPRPLLDFALAPGKLAVALRMARASMEMRGEIVRDSAERLRKFTMLFPVLEDLPYSGWQLDLAFRLLGRYGPRDVPLDYRRLDAREGAALPFIGQLADTAQLASVGSYTEYMFDWPERLCIDAVLDAERMGAVVRNHTQATLGERKDGVWNVHLNGDGTATVRAPIVLNMAGIWIDTVNGAATASPRRLILGTKGSHIVVKLPDAFKDYGMATINSVGEPHYVLPSQGGYHHIGPTETVYEGDLDAIKVDAPDRAFLLGETARILPGLELTEADIVYTWAGVRPLGFDAAYPKGKRSVEIHDLGPDGLPGVHALTAGPIMTHRTAGREMTQAVSRLIAPSGPPQQADYTPRGFPDNPNSPPLVAGDPRVKLSDLAHAATDEHAMTLADILISRTGAIYHTRLSEDDLKRAAQAVSVHLGWDRAETDRQIENTRYRLANSYQMD